MRLTSLSFSPILLTCDIFYTRKASRVVRHHGRRRRRSHGHHRHDDDGTTTKSTTKEKDRGEKMERGCRLVVVDVVRFVRDLQKHVARTVDRIPSEQRSRTRRRGRTVHRGAFLFFLRDDDLLLLQKNVVVSIVSFSSSSSSSSSNVFQSGVSCER